MKPLTQDENNAALIELIAQDRHSLAKLSHFIAFQCDVLGAPPAHYAEAEAQALLCARAIEYYESRLAPTPRKE